MTGPRGQRSYSNSKVRTGCSVWVTWRSVQLSTQHAPNFQSTTSTMTVSTDQTSRYQKHLDDVKYRLNGASTFTRIQHHVLTALTFKVSHILTFTGSKLYYLNCEDVFTAVYLPFNRDVHVCSTIKSHFITTAKGRRHTAMMHIVV